MAGTKISDATLRGTLKGTEELPIVDTDLPKGKTTVNALKTFVQSDTDKTPVSLDYSTIQGNGTVDSGTITELKEAINVGREIVLNYNGALCRLSSYEQNEEDQYMGLSFISEGMDVSAVVLNVVRLEINTGTEETTVMENLTPALTIFGEDTTYLSGNGQYMPLPKIPTKVSELQNDSNYTTMSAVEAKGYLTEHQDISGLATKTELNAKVSGTGVTSIQVVTELPAEQQSGVLYIVQESEEETA